MSIRNNSRSKFYVGTHTEEIEKYTNDNDLEKTKIKINMIKIDSRDETTKLPSVFNARLFKRESKKLEVNKNNTGKNKN